MTRLFGRTAPLKKGFNISTTWPALIKQMAARKWCNFTINNTVYETVQATFLDSGIRTSYECILQFLGTYSDEGFKDWLGLVGDKLLRDEITEDWLMNSQFIKDLIRCCHVHVQAVLTFPPELPSSPDKQSINIGFILKQC